MKKAFLAVAVMVLTTGVFAENDHAFLGMFAETSSMKMIGMPAMPQLPAGMELPNVPGLAGMMGMFAPQRTLTVRLWSPGLAPAESFARIAIPDGLKQGRQLNLELYRPKPGQTEEEETGPGGAATPQRAGQFTIKRYWGSSATVKPGQPQVTTINWDTLTPEQRATMRRMQERAKARASYFYKPDWTTGYWPTQGQPGAIAKDAALPGQYELTTNYTGNVTLPVPDIVNFLPGIELDSPKLDKAPPLAEAIRFHWAPITGALGLNAEIMGMVGTNTLILWSSSEVPTGRFGGDNDYMQMADVRARVEATEFMAGTRQDVTVPAGIFADCDLVNFSMIGWGSGAARDDSQPLARMQTKTTLRIMLGGKKMPAMGRPEEE